MKNKFNVGETILYKNGDRYELGVVKEIIDYERTYRIKQKQDGIHGKPTGEEVTDIAYKYRVNYHTGDTSALTDEDLLIKLANEYAFLVLRRKADDAIINTTPARQLANEILTELTTYVYDNFSELLFNIVNDETTDLTDYTVDEEHEFFEPGLLGNYYNYEDLITKLINEFKIK